MLKNLADEINLLANQGEMRKAYVFGAFSVHSTPIIYVNENNTKALFVLDSLGSTKEAELLYGYLAKDIAIYAVKGVRQGDTISCHTEADVFARYATAFDPKTNRYLIPDIISLMTSRQPTDMYDIKLIKLPDIFLKTAQRSEFVLQNKEGANNPVHKNETLTEFHKRHQEERRTGHDGEKKKVNAYLCHKGFQYAQPPLMSLRSIKATESNRSQRGYSYS